MILVDPRVGKCGNQTAQERLAKFIRILKTRVKCKVTAAVPQLNSGDVAFDGNGPEGLVAVGVELKKISDLCGSMRSDRLAGEQLVKMSKEYDVVFVIVEGYWKASDRGVLMTMTGREWRPLDLSPRGSKNHQYFHYSEPFKHLISLGVQKNVIVLRSMNEDETLWQIAHLHSWWQTPWEDHKSADPIKLQADVLFTRVSLLRRMAAELPGIGWTRSKAVEQAFGSVQRMIHADVEDWLAIEGIGPKTAENVWTIIRTKLC